MDEKYNTCIHAEKVGQIAVYVKPTCPNYTMLKGYMVSSKQRCKKCRKYKCRGDGA